MLIFLFDFDYGHATRLKTRMSLPTDREDSAAIVAADVDAPFYCAREYLYTHKGTWMFMQS